MGALAHEKPESYLAVIAATAVAGFLLTIPLRMLFRKLWVKSISVMSLGMVAACYVLALGWRWLQNILYYDWVKNDWQPEHFLDYVGGVLG